MVVGVVLVVVSVVLISRSRAPAADFQSAPAEVGSSGTTPAAATSPPQPATDAAPTSTTEVPTVPPAPVLGLPSRLVVPALAVDAAVVTVAQSAGILDVPADPQQVGWWAGGALPGADAGSTVVVGHVDTARDGPGALYRVEDLVAGDQVMIQTQGGDTLTYQVSERHTYPKNTGLPATLFDRAGPPRLVLITCGGPFDATIGSYEDNVAVIASPVA